MPCTDSTGHCNPDVAPPSSLGTAHCTRPDAVEPCSQPPHTQARFQALCAGQSSHVPGLGPKLPWTQDAPQLPVQPQCAQRTQVPPRGSPRPVTWELATTEDHCGCPQLQQGQSLLPGPAALTCNDSVHTLIEQGHGGCAKGTQKETLRQSRPTCGNAPLDTRPQLILSPST